MNHRELPVMKRNSQHDGFILANLDLFHFFFSPEKWQEYTYGKVKDKPGGIFMTQKWMHPCLIIFCATLKDHFQYNPKTPPESIVLHVKRRYNILTQNP